MRSVNHEILTQQGIKAQHLKEIYLRSLETEGISRAQLKREMHLSFPSVSVLVDELIESRIIEETGVVSSAARGRPSMLLRVCPERYVIPVVTMQHDGYKCRLFDFAARQIECIMLPYEAKLLAEADAYGRRQPDMMPFFAPLIRWIAEIKMHHRPLALLISSPGNVSEDGSLTSSSLRLTIPAGFISYLSENTGLNVRLGNTSDDYAYGEYYSSKQTEDFALILISRGVGAAVVRNGIIVDSRPVRAGEFGHISIDYRGKDCMCGGKGCLERYISTAEIASEANMDFEALCALYRADDPEITRIVNEKAMLVAVGISNMLTMQPVRHVILGGQIMLLGEKFLTAVRENISRVGFRKAMDKISVRYSQSGEGAEALGALRNYLENHLKIEDLI